MKFLVIGKNSYIGGSLVSYLSEIDNTQVVSVSSHQCDLLKCSQVRELVDSLEGNSWEIVFLAAINKWKENSYRAFCDNLRMVKNVGEAVRLNASKISSFLYSSSVDVYGRSPALPLTEETIPNPVSWYGVSKYVGERMLLDIEPCTIPVTVLRLPGIFGKAKNDRSIIGKFVDSVLLNRTIHLTAKGQVRRDFVFVEDVCRLILTSAQLDFSGVLNVATGISIPMCKIVDLISEALDRKASVSFINGRASRDFDLEFSNARLKSLLPQFSFLPLESGLRSYRIP